jgi:hypothetical protein
MSEAVMRAVNPEEYFFSWGVIKVFKEGFAEGDAVIISADSDDWALSSGIGKDITAVRQSNPLTTITLRLDESSPINSLLSAKRNAVLAGLVPPADVLLCKGSGAKVYGGPKFILLGPPKEVKLSDSKQVLEWRFQGSCTRVDGGNAEL